MQSELIEHIKNRNVEKVKTLLEYENLVFHSNTVLQSAIETTPNIYIELVSCKSRLLSKPYFDIINLILNDHRIDTEKYLTEFDSDKAFLGKFRHRIFFEALRNGDEELLIFLNNNIYHFDIDFYGAEDLDERKYYIPLLNIDYIKNNLLEFLYCYYSDSDVENLKNEASKLIIKNIMENF